MRWETSVCLLLLAGTGAESCQCFGLGPVELAITPACCTVAAQPACNADRVCTGLQVPLKNCLDRTRTFWTKTGVANLPPRVLIACNVSAVVAGLDTVTKTCANASKVYIAHECSNAEALPYCGEPAALPCHS